MTDSTFEKRKNLNNSDLSYFCKMSISMFVYFLQNFQTPNFFCEMTNSTVEKDGKIQINFKTLNSSVFLWNDQ